MKPDEPGAIGDDDAFSVLLMAAEEDRAFNDQLTTILALPDFHRKSLINTLLQDLRMRGAPYTLIRAVGYLLDDAVAGRALTMLKGP